jgi:hypothetical protein
MHIGDGEVDLGHNHNIGPSTMARSSTLLTLPWLETPLPTS